MSNARGAWRRRLFATLVLLACVLVARPAESGQGKVRGTPGNQRLDLIVYFSREQTDQELQDWEPVFTEASKLLYDATEGQLRLGRITWTTSRSLADRADVHVLPGSGGAVASPNGFGLDGTHIVLYEQTHKSTGEGGGARGQFGIVHELAHYLFDVDDEYSGCRRVATEPCIRQTYDFPMEPAAGGTPAGTPGPEIRGQVYEDTGAEPHVFDAGDTPQAQELVVLERLEPGGAPQRVGVVQTDEQGTYTFGAQSLGQYHVRLLLNAEGDFASEAIVVDGAATLTEPTLTPTLPLPRDDTGRNVRTGDFPLTRTKPGVEQPMQRGTIDGVLYADSGDAQYLQDSGDKPLEGVPLLLERVGNDQPRRIVGYAVTDTRGGYAFVNRPLGRYELSVLGLDSFGLANTAFVLERNGRKVPLAHRGGPQQKPVLPFNLSAPAAERDRDAFFCGANDDALECCIMDGGTGIRPNNQRSEFCTSHPAASVEFRHLRTYSQGATLITNGQEWTHAEGCWQTIARSKVPLQPPAGDPVPQALPADQLPTFERSGENQGVVLLLDASESANTPPPGGGESAFEQGTTAVKGFIDGLKAGEVLSVAVFSTDADVVFPSQVVDVSGNVKAAAKAAVDAIQPEGFTNILSGLQEALGEVQDLDDQDVAGKSIVLLTDGKGTVGGDPLDILPDVLAEDRLEIHTFGLGSAPNAELLERLSNRTGGRFAAPSKPEDRALLLPKLLAAARGDVVIAEETGLVGAGEEATTLVDVDQFAEVLTFLLAHPTDPYMDLRITSPSGVVFDHLGDQAGVTPPGGMREFPSGLEFVGSDVQRFFRIPGAYVEPGTWTVTAINRRVSGGPDEFALLVTEEASDLAAIARVEGDGVIAYPDPIRVSVSVYGPRPIGGAEVTARVIHPGGHEDVIALFDDGLAEHADEHVEDGVYSALFTGYRSASDGGRDGIYLFEVAVENTIGYELSPGEDTLIEEVLEFVPPFTIRAEVRAVVTGVPDPIGTGAITLGAGTALSVDMPADELAVTPVLSFDLTAEDEMARLTSLRVGSSGDGDERTIDEVALFLDADRDGAVDNEARPLARTQFTLNDGTAIFETGGTLLTIPAGETRRLLVTFGSPRAPALADLQGRTVPLPGPLVGLLLAALATALALRLVPSRRPRAAWASCGAACCLLLAVAVAATTGCGDGGGRWGLDTFIPETARQVIEPPGVSPGSYDLTLDPGDISAMGGTTGAPVPTLGQPVTSGVVLR